jgi:hypothetical protein
MVWSLACSVYFENSDDSATSKNSKIGKKPAKSGWLTVSSPKTLLTFRPSKVGVKPSFHGLINSSLLAVSLRKDKALEEW